MRKEGTPIVPKFQLFVFLHPCKLARRQCMTPVIPFNKTGYQQTNIEFLGRYVWNPYPGFVLSLVWIIQISVAEQLKYAFIVISICLNITEYNNSSHTC